MKGFIMAKYVRELTGEPMWIDLMSSDSDRSVAFYCDLFGWTERQFAERMQGSAINRLGYERWLRNIAVALGNAVPTA